MDFERNGINGGLFYDKTDEIEAYTRQNLFGSYQVNPISYVNQVQPSLQPGPKSYSLLTPNEQFTYLQLLRIGRFR